MVVYDNAAWHMEGVEPDGLPLENAATHIAMFIMWALERNLASDWHATPTAVLALERQLHFRDYYLYHCNAEFTTRDLNEVCNAFADEYYGEPYFDDYHEALGRHYGSFYGVEALWENYEIMRHLLDEQFEGWQRGKR